MHIPPGIPAEQMDAALRDFEQTFVDRTFEDEKKRQELARGGVDRHANEGSEAGFALAPLPTQANGPDSTTQSSRTEDNSTPGGGLPKVGSCLGPDIIELLSVLSVLHNDDANTLEALINGDTSEAQHVSERRDHQRMKVEAELMRLLNVSEKKCRLLVNLAQRHMQVRSHIIPSSPPFPLR